eukprot:gene35351-43590_t
MAMERIFSKQLRVVSRKRTRDRLIDDTQPRSAAAQQRQQTSQSVLTDAQDEDAVPSHQQKRRHRDVEGEHGSAQRRGENSEKRVTNNVGSALDTARGCPRQMLNAPRLNAPRLNAPPPSAHLKNRPPRVSASHQQSGGRGENAVSKTNTSNVRVIESDLTNRSPRLEMPNRSCSSKSQSAERTANKLFVRKPPQVVSSLTKTAPIVSNKTSFNMFSFNGDEDDETEHFQSYGDFSENEEEDEGYSDEEVTNGEKSAWFKKIEFESDRNNTAGKAVKSTVVGSGGSNSGRKK